MLTFLKRALFGRLIDRLERRVDAAADMAVAARMREISAAIAKAAEPRPLPSFQVAEVEGLTLQRLFPSPRRVTEASQPNLDPLPFALRDLRNMRWDIKVLGSAIARHLYAAGQIGGVVPDSPARISLTSKLCCQADIEQPWFHYWADQLKMAALYHRKVWEDAYVLQALWEAGLLEPGRRGLGFAVGTEALPAYFTGRGIEVLATDLETTDERSVAWKMSDQHVASLDQLYKPDLVSRAEFDRLCRYQPLDMNAIPPDLHGQFDFCWSVCSLEHVGSIEQGLQFVQNATRCLKPGGVGVHTTEFNLETGTETIDNWPTVLFQRKHIDDLGQRLAADGHELMAVDYDAGSGVLDGFVDLPPYKYEYHSTMPMDRPPHLRLSVDGFPVTSIALIVRAGG